MMSGKHRKAKRRREYTNHIADLAFSLDGSQIVSASHDMTACVWMAVPLSNRDASPSIQAEDALLQAVSAVVGYPVERRCV